MIGVIYSIYLLNNNILIVVLYIIVDAAFEQNELKKQHLIKRRQ